MDTSKYIEIFIEESRENLQSLNTSLLELEKNPSEVSIVNDIFRIAHTLKGMAGTMGFTKMTKLTHVMEDALHLLRTGEKKLDSGMIDSLFKCLDALEGYVASIIDEGSEGNENHQALIQTLESIVHGKGEAPKSAAPEKKEEKKKENGSISKADSDNWLEIKNDELYIGGVDTYPEIKLDRYELDVLQKASEMEHRIYRVDMSLDKGCLLKSARSFLFFQALERHGDVIKSVPSSEDIEDEKFEFDISCVVLSQSKEEDLMGELEKLSEVEKVSLKLVNLSEAATESGKVEEETEETEVQIASEKTQEEVKPAQQGASGGKASKHQKTVRVDIDRLDILMNLVSELIIIKTRLEGINVKEADKNYGEAVEYLERITTNLHDAVMKVRMVPIETVFNRFPRMIRDIAKTLGKDIDLQMSGEETELDRTVIDEIGDPLIHLLRNSVDHGIESVEKRRQTGKPETGHIYLRAYGDGNNVVIEVEDDGGGINLARVKQKAIERGLVNTQNAANLSPKEIVDFLFMPAFSTADQITDLSGRGVGLDVVKTKIESLGGFVEVNTEEGKGTKFIIRLPLTLAIIQALMVVVGNEKYAIPLGSIQELIKVERSDIKLVQQKETLLLRDNIIPILWLSNILEVSDAQCTQNQSLTVVVVKRGDRLIGVVVDALIGQHEIVIKSLGKLMQDLKIIAGATIMGDGNVALIVDVNTLS